MRDDQRKMINEGEDFLRGIERHVGGRLREGYAGPRKGSMRDDQRKMIDEGEDFRGESKGMWAAVFAKATPGQGRLREDYTGPRPSPRRLRRHKDARSHAA
jgi:hypothetical protein